MEERTIRKVQITVFIFALCISVFFIFFHNVPPEIEKNKIKKAAFISYISEFNFRQTPNDCGPYSTAAVARVLIGGEIDSQKFAKEIPWRLPNKYSLPWGLESQMRAHNIVPATPYMRSFSDVERIYFLQQQLSREKPIIILGEKNNVQHYITLFGFDASKDEFYVYDSLHEKNPHFEKLTLDDNGSLPGNRTFSSKALLDFWRKGGMYGVYKWYALVASR